MLADLAVVLATQAVCLVVYLLTDHSDGLEGGSDG